MRNSSYENTIKNFSKNRSIEKPSYVLSSMRGNSIFQKTSYREIRPMGGHLMRGLPVFYI